MQQNDDKKLELSVYPLNDVQLDYFLEGIDYLAMQVDVEHSEGDRRALAAANQERNMGNL